MADTRTTEEVKQQRGGAAPRGEGKANVKGPAAGRRKKKRNTGIIVAVVAILVMLVIMVVIFGKSQEADAITVEVQSVSTRTIVQTVTATGVIDPETQVKISPEVSGEIVFLGAQEGEVVHKGQVLVKINPESMMAQRDEAQAQISAAQARIAQTRASLLRNQQDLARVKQLHEKKLSTDQDLETAQAQVNIAEAELDAARFQADQAQAAFRRVRESLAKTTIVSPISGVVTKLNSKIGEKVVGAIQMTGTEIMTVADLSVIEAVVDVSENDVVQVSLGDVAEVEVDAIPNQKFRAIVSRIANSPKQSGMGTQEQVTNFEVRLRFVNPDVRFRPGMTATATVETEKKSNIMVVPIQSVTTRDNRSEEEKKKDEEQAQQEEEGAAKNVQLEKTQKKDDAPQPVVFVKVGEKVYARKVTTGIRDDQYIEIVGGLKPGDTVVSGSYKAITKDLKDSSRVSVTKKNMKDEI